MNLCYGLHKAFWRVVDYLYPPACAVCGKANYRLCPACLNQIDIIDFAFCAMCGKRVQTSQIVCNECSSSPVYLSAVASWGKYGGVLRDAIHALKYKNDVGLADYFSDHMIRLITQKSWVFDIVIPVPLSKERRKERSYNQSALLSRPIAQYFHVDHSTSALKRVRDTGSQTKRGKTDRNLVLEDAFWANPAKLKGRSVLLVDDIITTGATINHCSAALIQAGAEKVYVVSIAKTFRLNFDQN